MCPYGERCNFSHDLKICTDFIKQKCDRGQHCPYRHVYKSCPNFDMGFCISGNFVNKSILYANCVGIICTDTVKKVVNVQTIILKYLYKKIFKKLKYYMKNYLNHLQKLLYVEVVKLQVIKLINVQKEYKFNQKMHLNVGFVDLRMNILKIVTIYVDYLCNY